MFGADDDDRTEPASPRRLEEARRSGHVPRSHDLTAAILLLACAACASLFGPGLLQAGRDLFRDSLTRVSTSPADLRYRAQSWQSLAILQDAAIGIVSVLLFAAVTANVLQFGLRLTPDAVRPEWERVNFGRGLRRLGMAVHPAGVAFTCLKLLLLALITIWSVVYDWPRLSGPSHLPPADLAAAWGLLVTRLAWQIAAVLLALSIGDLLYQRRRFELGLRMTRHEAREEARQQEGDPTLHRRQRDAVRPLPVSRTERLN